VASQNVEQTGTADPGLVAAMVERADAGDAGAKDALFASLYGELHRLAQNHLRQRGSQLTMSATTLVHEAYLDLSGRSTIAFPDRLRFLKYASRAMRHLIIDYARTRRAVKRGGEITFMADSQEEAVRPASTAPLETLSDALDELAGLDAALAELVDLKFFCGFSFNEIAVMRGVSERTIQRDWAKARLLLQDALRTESDGTG
jgi:RNA polymerase sigma factor (TIGR02999 family)